MAHKPKFRVAATRTGWTFFDLDSGYLGFIDYRGSKFNISNKSKLCEAFLLQNPSLK